MRKERRVHEWTIGDLDAAYRKVAGLPDARERFIRRIRSFQKSGFPVSEAMLARRYPDLNLTDAREDPTSLADAKREEKRLIRPALRQAQAIEIAAPPASAFEPPPILDAIVPLPIEKLRSGGAQPSRIGQADFRAMVLAAYDGACAVTGCRVETVLDAAHIIPHVDERSHLIQNGICLRTDIHRLFDAGLLSIESDYSVSASAQLAGTSYEELAGERLLLPADKSHAPDRNLLAIRPQFITSI